MTMIYYLKRKFEQVRTVIWWIPRIWNNFDFDYFYSVQMFRHQLERQAKFLESGKAVTKDAEFQASKIKTAIKLIDKIYGSEYICYQTEERSFDILWKFINHNIRKWWD